jgi:septum site-determining protein MinC
MTNESLALDFKSATLYAIRVVLHSADLDRLKAALDKRMNDAGSFFENEPVVLDAARVDDPIDWPILLDALRAHNLPVIGVVAEGENRVAACAVGLTPVELSVQARVAQTLDVAPTVDTKAAPALAAAADKAGAANGSQASVAATVGSPVAPHSSSALVITKPLRSGQRVYARHTDLVVIGMVSQGAEVIADGNIHVYGPLRGKAMAGARGDTSARVFTTQLDAELLAVAGVYRVVEDKLEGALHNQPALIRLEGDALRIESLKP